MCLLIILIIWYSCNVFNTINFLSNVFTHLKSSCDLKTLAVMVVNEEKEDETHTCVYALYARFKQTATQFTNLNYKCSFCSSFKSIRFACKLILMLLLKSIASKSAAHVLLYAWLWPLFSTFTPIYSHCYAVSVALSTYLFFCIFRINETKVSFYVFINHIRIELVLELLTFLIISKKKKKKLIRLQLESRTNSI